MHGMSNPILKMARPGYSAITTSNVNLSFSSDFETPKIFLQTNSGWTNTIGYIPSIMTFRQLNSTDFTHDLQIGNDSDPQQGAYLNTSTGSLTINKRSGDTDMFAMLYFTDLSGTPPVTLERKGEPRLVIAKEGYSTNAYPANLALDSRFDTFKIFKTGTMTLNMPAETLVIGAANKVYVSEVTHSLGYPPIYFPQATVDWDLGGSGVENSSFVVNDYIGYLISFGLTGRAELDVYTDSSKLYMKCTRKSNLYFDVSFNAVTITMYYTILYNEIGEEFNLLET